MFKKPEDITPLPSGMMDAFNKTLNSQLGNYKQSEPVAETPAEEPAPEQQVEESVDTEAVNRVITGQDETLEASAEDQNEVIEGGTETVCEDNTNDVSDDGDGLDKVQPKAVKKKFKDRKDKDIDNDGDVDDSDRYLHNRRKAISKALEGIDGRTRAFKEKVAQLSYTKEETEELDEAKFDDNDFVHIAKANVTSFYNPKTDKIIGFSKAPKNPNRAPKPKKGANAVMRIGDAKKKKYNFTLPVNRRNFGEESGDLGKPKGFFSEEMDPTDHVRYNKETNMFCVYDKDGKKVYESEKEEEANQYAIDNHDALMGRGELAEVLPPHLAKFFDKDGNFKDKKKQKVFNKMMGDGIGKEIAKDMGRIKFSVDADEKKKKVFIKVDRNDVADAVKALKKHPAYISGAMKVTINEAIEMSMDAMSQELGMNYDMEIGDSLDPMGVEVVSDPKGNDRKYSVELKGKRSNFKKAAEALKDIVGADKVTLRGSTVIFESVDLEEKLKFKTTKKIKGKVFGKISGPFPKAKAEVIAAREFRSTKTEIVKDGSGYSIFVPVNESVDLEEAYPKAPRGMRWKQTNSMTAAQAIKKYGKKNVEVKKGGLRSGEDYIQVLVPEGLGPEDESKVKEIIGKLKGASKAHAGQAKDLEKAMKSESSELEEGFSNFLVPIPKQTLNGKKIGGGKTPIVVKARSAREAISKAAKQLGVDFKFLKTGKVVKEAIDPADVDDMVATKGDKESAKMNIIVQLRKAADVKGNLDIVFADGKKKKIPANIIKIALDKYNSFRKPATKKKLIDGMTKSYRSMLQTLKTIKEYSEKSESKES